MTWTPSLSNGDRTRLAATLASWAAESCSVLAGDLRAAPVTVLDLTADNQALRLVDLSDPVAFDSYVRTVVESRGAAVGIGRYGEDRVIYRHSGLFDGAEPRSVHLGIDLFVPAGSPLFAPLAGTVHSVADNAANGDYGPTILLRHARAGVVFHTLMGHLHPSVLDRARPGQPIAAGALLGTVGSIEHNGGWPPHVHFQIIGDLGAYEGDYPGVAAKSEADRWLAACPDPNLLLRIPDDQLSPRST